MEKKKVYKYIRVVVEEPVYGISELSPEAKAVAIKNRRQQNNDDFWWFADEIKTCFKEMGERLGFYTAEYRYDMCGYSYTKLSPSDFDLLEMDVRRTMAYVWNNWIEPYLGVHKNFKESGPSCVPDKAQLKRLGWKRAPRLAEYWNCPYTGMCYDYVMLEAYEDFVANRARKPGATFSDFLEVLGEKMTKEIMDEANHRDSDEGIEEDLEANEVLFLADGSVADIVKEKKTAA